MIEELIKRFKEHNVHDYDDFDKIVKYVEKLEDTLRLTCLALDVGMNPEHLKIKIMKILEDDDD